MLNRVAKAAVLSLVLGCSGAQAAIYTGFWDPLFNPAFSGAVSGGQEVWWKGSVNLTVSDSCIAAGTTQTVSACGSASVDGFGLTLYDPVPPDLNPNIVTTVGAGLFPNVTQLQFDPFGALTSLSGISCVRHSMTTRSIYAKQDEVEERGHSGQVGGAAVDSEGAD